MSLAALRKPLVDSGWRNILRHVPSGCVLYYPALPEGFNATTVRDFSGNRNDGSISGAVWGIKGITMDGDDYIELNDGSDASPLNFTSGNFTLIFNGYISDLTEVRVIFQRGLYQTDGYYWMVNTTTGNSDFYTNQAATTQRNQSAPGAFVVNTYASHAIVRNGTAIGMFKNGVSLDKDVTTAITNPATCARTAKLGVHDDKAQRFWKGLIGEVWAYNRALTALELQYNYRATRWRYS